MIAPANGARRRLSPLNEMLSDLLQRAGLNKTHTIRVTGPASLAALLWFCRHGYEQVGWIRGSHGHSEDGDLLLVPQTCSVAALEQLIKRGPRPRPGGVLIVQTPPPSPDSGSDPAHSLLCMAGYRVERCVHGRHRELHVARRPAMPVDQLAA